MGRGGKYNVPSLPQLGDRRGGNSALQNNSDLAHGPVGRPRGSLGARYSRREGPPMSGMGRREFVALLGSAAAGWPLATRAQRPALPVVGFLGSLSQSAQSTWTAAFVQRMREHGWIEDRTVAIEYRWAEG